MIISLHTPKSGGSSFRALLIDHYGIHFREDYGDQPIGVEFDELIRRTKRQEKNMAFYKRHILKFTKVRCVHGHFLPYKYKIFLKRPNVKFVTWLRDPSERLASHYHYWKRTLDQFENPHPLHIIMIRDNWSLEDFCFSKEMKNIYSRFLWEFPLENFSFIGVTEYFEEDLNYFIRHFLNLENQNIPAININVEKEKSYFQEGETLEKLKTFHSLDYELYEQALKIRSRRENLD